LLRQTIYRLKDFVIEANMRSAIRNDLKRRDA